MHRARKDSRDAGAEADALAQILALDQLDISAGRFRDIEVFFAEFEGERADRLREIDVSDRGT